MQRKSIVSWLEANSSTELLGKCELDSKLIGKYKFNKIKLTNPIGIPKVIKNSILDYSWHSTEWTIFTVCKITPEALMDAYKKPINESKGLPTFSCDDVQLKNDKGQNAFHYLFQGVVRSNSNNSKNNIILEEDLPKIFEELKTFEDRLDYICKLNSTLESDQINLITKYQKMYAWLESKGLIHNSDDVEEECIPGIVNILLKPFFDADSGEYFFDALNASDNKGNKPLHYLDFSSRQRLNSFKNVFSLMSELSQKQRTILLLSENNNKKNVFSLFLAKAEIAFWNVFEKDFSNLINTKNSLGQNVLHVIFIANTDTTIEKVAEIQKRLSENDFIELLFHKDNSGKVPVEYLKLKAIYLIKLFELLLPKHAYMIWRILNLKNNNFDESSEYQGAYKTIVRKFLLFKFADYFLKNEKNSTRLRKLEDAVNCIEALCRKDEFKACSTSFSSRKLGGISISSQRYHNLREELTLINPTLNAIKEVRDLFTEEKWVVSLFQKDIGESHKTLIRTNMARLFSKIPQLEVAEVKSTISGDTLYFPESLEPQFQIKRPSAPVLEGDSSIVQVGFFTEEGRVKTRMQKGASAASHEQAENEPGSLMYQQYYKLLR